MLTVEEAHAYLEKQQTKMTTYRHFYTEEAIEANGLAILALEKQIPKRPIVVSQEESILRTWRCPTCGSYNIEKRCDDCGQLLKWGDD